MKKTVVILKSAVGIAFGLYLGWFLFVKMQMLPVSQFMLNQQAHRIDALERRLTNFEQSVADLATAVTMLQLESAAVNKTAGSYLSKWTNSVGTNIDARIKP